MKAIESVIADAKPASIVRGIVVGARGTITVALEGVLQPLTCDVLHSSGVPLMLVEGDEVLVWCASHEDLKGVILGRVGPSHAPTYETADVPDELVLEAKHSLTLRVGDGTITIREDGKVLLKGRDIVSHAVRTHRIRGGSVAIN